MLPQLYRQIQQFHRLFGWDRYSLTDIQPHLALGQRVPSHTLHIQTQLKEEDLWKDRKVLWQKKIKSIMIIHISKTRAQVKSIALISIGPNIRMKKKKIKIKLKIGQWAQWGSFAILSRDNSFTVIASENDSMCMHLCWWWWFSVQHGVVST